MRLSSSDFRDTVGPIRSALIASIAALAAVFLCFESRTAEAGIIRVFPDGSGDAPTIAKAFLIAAPLDTVLLGDGVFAEHDLDYPSRVSLHSESGDPARTIIDAESAGRCMTMGSVTGAPTIRGITFRNGVHDVEGGLIRAGQVNARFHDCVFENGAAPRAGAVAILAVSRGNAPYFYDCRFTSNEATAGDGGAIRTLGTGYFEECSFTGNSASGNGGALDTDKSRDWGPWLRTCSFEENVAGGEGGAVYSRDVEEYYVGTWIENGTFRGNRATRGGAARLEGYDFSAGTLFLANEATESGGALYLVSTIVDKEFDFFSYNVYARNTAGARGGAIYLTGVDPLLQGARCTFAGNTAPQGAHLHSDLEGVWGVLFQSILAFGIGGAAVEGNGVLDATCIDVFGNEGGDFTGPLAGEVGVDGNFSLDPLFCLPLLDDYTVAATSPCVTGLPAECGSGPVGRYGAGCDEVAGVDDGLDPGPGSGPATQLDPFALELTVSPSPARGPVQVRYRLGSEGAATLAVHGANGRRIALLAETAAPGTHQATWDGRNDDGVPSPSGVYFVRFAQGDRAIARTIVRLP